MNTSITFAASAVREIQRLPKDIARRVLAKIETLAEDPRPAGSKKIIGSENLWRIRIGDYRAIYRVDDVNRAVDIAAVRHRSDAYR